ncbi:MAG: hypothetical protein QOH16_3865 [Gaiellaceae bacterium]|nr:hypothetical protein [Gaiellaceae bacterium]
MRDIAIVPTGTDDATADDYRDHRPVDGVDIGHGVSIARLPDAEYDLMMAACRPRGHFYYSQPQWGQRYAFVLNVQLATYHQNHYGWDQEQILSSALALSRFVRDNVHCTEFAGRVVDHEDGEQQVIPLYGFDFRLAYRYGRTRDWLDAAEAAELRTLLDRFRQIEPDWPPRVKRGIRNCDRASQMPYLSESQPRLVTAFEALLNTSSGHVSKQFRTRVGALAVELGIEGVSLRLLDRMYDFRSKAYHGDEIYLFSGDPDNQQPEIAEQHRRTVEEAALLQRVLRAAVRKTIEDDDFRAVFEEDDQIRQRWPVLIREDGAEREI